MMQISEPQYGVCLMLMVQLAVGQISHDTRETIVAVDSNICGLLFKLLV